MQPSERYEGALLGLAVGDALGAAVEFSPRGSFRPVTGMRGGGPFGLKAGYWTDDTSMALCLAESLVEKGFDPADQMSRYLRWYREGYLSSTGSFFDIGVTTSAALERFERTGEPYSGDDDESSSGNGSLMRLAPVPLFFAATPEDAIQRSGDSSRTTHASRACVDACRYFGGIIAGALSGVRKSTLLRERFHPTRTSWTADELHPVIDAIAVGSFRAKDRDGIKGTGYVAHSLEAALWAFNSTDSFEEGCLLVVNLGGDTDTMGAIYGQLAGVYYGASAIPKAWLDVLAHRETIADIATRLLTSRP